jgi:hypothetical protein
VPLPTHVARARIRYLTEVASASSARSRSRPASTARSPSTARALLIAPMAPRGCRVDLAVRIKQGCDQYVYRTNVPYFPNASAASLVNGT